MPASAQPTSIAGRYRVQREVGRGGMGSVWLAHDDRLGREVALKAVGRLPGQSVTDQARALREARSLAALNHPHVVGVYDAVAEDDHVWLVMEYVPGRTLAEIIKQDGPLEPARAAAIGAQVADGLAAAHARSTVHRDVKPGNILVGEGDLAKISDFGIARTLGEETLTEHGMLTGTPTYFAPELARGQDPSPASDVWALGATLYAAVEGRPPYPGQPNTLALLASIAEERPPAPVRAGPLTDPIGRMMDPDPSTRWSMADAAHALHQHATAGAPATTKEEVPAAAPAPAPDPDPTPAPAPTPAPVTTDDDRRRRGGLGLLLAGLLALAVIAAGGLFLLNDDGDEEPEPTASTSSASSPKPSRTKTPDPTPTQTVTETATAEPSETAEPTTSAPTSAPAPPASGGAAGFVQDYYAVLPEDIDAGWSLLSESYQAETTYGDYEAFWSTIDDVAVTSTRPAGPGAIDAELVYTQDGSTQSETRRIYYERSGDGFLITGSELV